MKQNVKKRQPPKSRARKKRGPQSAQQTIPYREMLQDGICKVREGYYTKTLSYDDINYAVASSNDQATIFDGYCGFLNYFDATLPFQMSFINHRSRPENRYSVNIPPQNDDHNIIRGEFTGMIKNQIARSNNGIMRSKFITYGINTDGIATARPRLERMEADIMGNFKKLGVQSAPLSGRERLEVIHGQLHPGGKEKFIFSWDMIPKTGLGTKDFIAPTSFDFRQSRVFRVGTTWGAASYMQIMASELSDKLLAELLEVDAEMTITMHVQTVDQAKAIKTVKGKLSDIDRMKMDEQKKAVRSGYDMDILPPDLLTYSKDAATLLADLQSRNERMFLLTFTIVNTAPTRQQLENDIFTVSGITQKYNCFLKRMDFQQEQGFMSSLPLGWNGIPSRKIANVLLWPDDADTGSGTIDYTSEPFTNALLATETAAKAAKLGFRMITDARAGKHYFSVYAGRNLTADQTENPPCIFSQEFDNIVEQEYTNSVENFKTTAYVGGEETEPRVVAEVGSGAGGLDRDEVFVNATDITKVYKDCTNHSYNKQAARTAMIKAAADKNPPVYTVKQISGDRVVIAYGGVTVAAVKKGDLALVK